MRSVFVSYKRQHAPTAQVVEALQRALEPTFDVWRDVSIEPGKAWSAELYGWLLHCDASVAVVSEESVGADWCRREWAVLAARQQTAGLPLLAVHVGGQVHRTETLDHLQAIVWDEANPTASVSKVLAALEQVRERMAPHMSFLAAHHAWLRWQYESAPVLGQEPYALRDVYIDTECGKLKWAEINESPRHAPVDAFACANGGRQPLVQTVLAQMAEKAFNDLIVVQAGPGSGKSAFTLRLANELLAKGFWPVLVRFRDLRLATFPDIAELIDDAMRIGGSDDQSPQPEGKVVSELFDQTHELDGTKLGRAVLVFDGWDEVSLTGNVDYQAQLKDWLPRLRQYLIGRRGPAPLRVVLTGRPSSEVGSSGALQKATPVLTVRPMRPEQLKTHAKQIGERLAAARRDGRPATWFLDPARLQPLFDEYGKWFEAYEKGQESEAQSSSDVLGNPLLAYLALRVVCTSSAPIEELIKEPTALYHELIEVTVANAGKGEDAGIEGAVHRGGARLRVLLQEVAATISLLRAESVSYTELKERFSDPNLPLPHQELRDWSGTDKTENALRELVVNFYFKGGKTALGCEFLHKSFREYLFAEAIVAAIRDALPPGAKRDVFNDHPGGYAQDFASGTAEHRLSRRLSYLLGPQWLSNEVQRHLFWLLQREAEADPSRWTELRDLLTDIYAWWAEGVHLRPQRTSSRRGAQWSPPFTDELFQQLAPFDDAERRFIATRSTALDAHLGYALMRTLCRLFSWLREGRSDASRRSNQYVSRHDNVFRFCPGAGFLPAIVGRINAEGWRVWSLSELVAGPVDIGFEKLNGACLDGAWLPKARLSHARLQQASFEDAHLIEADLGEARLEEAFLFRANFRGANLSKARLLGADLRSAQFQNANMTRTYLGFTRLRSVNCAGAKMDSAYLRSIESMADAVFDGVSFLGAELSPFVLAEASLIGATFDPEVARQIQAHQAKRVK